MNWRRPLEILGKTLRAILFILVTLFLLGALFAMFVSFIGPPPYKP